ncbi:Mitotic checkpoint regulator MAD2B-interacting family protein [Babesia bovis T2Bo]|uniref:Uncharacterized protein n=1 Tax=Babesia bovis TaxID=5865 RepID=A7AUH9_BABBO|nr:Mitotic checkpoint regulator MAD2B-interacting family protein [Babesia bovis T2Bo]EDO06590.1 Mitotic checkpoint regulator MAD2B-interacting family protein [Babesia bovis T2Bo]|eukprot:XP_001610158.1 hypothetical protein [Babesia bovis T2Bo]
MDWIQSALNQSDSSDEEDVESSLVAPENANPVQLNRDVNLETSNDDIQTDRGSVSTESANTLPGGPMFTIATATRKVDDFTKAEHIKINLPTDDLLQQSEQTPISQTNASKTTNHAPPKIITANDLEATSSLVEDTETNIQEPEITTSMDTLEIMQRFNMMHSDSKVKAPKRGDWFGGNIKITEIHADDLRMGSTEKNARYSTSKAALLEGRTAFKAPTRQLETDDGHVLTSNVLRKTSKRKHQISWLAADAQERELELLERTAQARKTKHETQMKYGW